MPGPGCSPPTPAWARCIHTLRRELAEAGGGDCIRTSGRRGYQLTVEVSLAGEPSASTRRPASLELTPGP